MEGRPRRSVLYMPGSNERALEKARSLPADALIFDLEDAVAPDAKPLAREKVCGAVKSGGYGGREIVIRINALQTPWGTEDLIAACEAGPDAILVPKVMHPGDITSVAKILQGMHASDDLKLWAMMETPMAILNARTIAATAVYAENRLCCFVMGTNDLIKESRARTLGMDGKTLIHPSQIAPCNEVFSPTEEEVDWSRKIIAAFRQPENAKKGVIVVEGRMVERLHLGMAERTVYIAESIREMEAACA